ncbi:MAG: hypothetical protein EOO43_25915 [Flavobacterium sp.]|nr:MAG: hypothetical protein EOO43_25915 [Flavobacterium sp.]
MSQEVNNEAPVGAQVNIGKNEGSVYLNKQTRLSKRFQRLKEEVEGDLRYDDFIDDLANFNTKLDGKSLTEKLEDGGFSTLDIKRANERNLSYWKKFEMYRFYESAQRIDIEIFAKIKLNFETYIEPLIDDGRSISFIKTAVTEKIVEPILFMLNNDGYDDVWLNYTSEEILGMVYFLSGKCHLNWKNYDNL